MFKLRNISLSNIIFKKNSLIDLSKYSSVNKLTAFGFSTDNNSDKPKTMQNRQEKKKDDKQPTPPKRVIVMKKADIPIPSPRKIELKQQQEQKKEEEAKSKEADFKPKVLSTLKKPPVVMKKASDYKPKSTQNIVTDIDYKEIIQRKTSENIHFLFNNTAVVKLMREYANLYTDKLKKKYNKILKQIIREKVLSIEDEIESMKSLYAKMQNVKIDLKDLKFNNETNSNLNNNNKDNNVKTQREFKNIFDLSKNSIKEIKEQIKALPKNKTESLSFNIEHSQFYLNVDIDKSFEIFKENIFAQVIQNNSKTVIENYATNFLLRVLELDRIIYLPDLLRFIESNNLSINESAKLLTLIETSTQNYSAQESFNYTALILNMKLLNQLLTQNEKNITKLSENELANITSIFESIIIQLTSFKVSNKIIHKDIQDDELLRLPYLLGFILQRSEGTLKSKDCLHKIFAIYYDNKDFIEFILQKFVEKLADNKAASNAFLQTTKDNLDAYKNNFGFLPNGFAENRVAAYYFKILRPSFVEKISKRNQNSAAEVEFVYFLLKTNNLKELQADLISLMDKSKAPSELIKALYADFILNTNLETNKFYYENLEKIYTNKNLNIQQEKDFANQLMYQTLAYIKDGNADFAISRMLTSIEKRAEFIKNNDAELLNLINGLVNGNKLNAGEDGDFEKEINVKLDSDFIPFIEHIKQNIRDLLAFECAFKTQKNVLLAKENIFDEFFDRKSNTEINKDYKIKVDYKNNREFAIAEKNYYNEKFNKIIYNLNQIKQLRQEKHKEYLERLTNKDSKKSFSKLTSTNNNNADLPNFYNKELEEIKVFIYSQFEDLNKFYSELSRTFRMNINRVEDIENMKFSSVEEKQNFMRGIDRKIREIGNYKTMFPELKQMLNFYKSFLSYIEQKPISLGNEVILSEDMLNYLENPDFLLNKEINVEQYSNKARSYFRDYYAKVQKRFPGKSLYVLENLDFLKTNLKIDLENFALHNTYNSNNSNIDLEANYINQNNVKDLISLKNKIEFYQKNLEFLKQVINRIPEFDIEAGAVNSSAINDNSDLLLKKLILFEAENATATSNAVVSADNKPNHLIEAYLKSFTGRTSKRILSNLTASTTAKKRQFYPFKAVNDRNLFRYLYTLNANKNQAVNVFNTFAEDVIVPTINSKQIGVYKNLLAQLQNLEQVVKGGSFDEETAVNDIYKEMLKNLNISFSKENVASAEEEKLQEMKDMIDQNFEIFEVQHCVYMIQFGVENNVAEAIRLGEKVCSDLGYTLPSHIENLVNKYLLTNGENYAQASEKIFPVDLARVYNNAKDLSINDSIANIYDELLQKNSPYAVDKLPLKGLEKAYDFRKFSNLIRHFNLKH